MSRRQGARGQSIAEFALVLPVFLLIVGGALDLGRLFYAYVAIENAAREGALYGASDPRCSDTKDGCSAPNTVRWRVENEAAGVPSLTHAVACLGGDDDDDSEDDDDDVISVNDCERGDRYRVSVASRFDFVTPILAPILGDHLDLRSTATSRVLSDAFDPDATPIPIPTPTPSPTPRPSPTSTPGLGPTPTPTGATPTPTLTPTPGSCTVPNLDGVRRNSAQGVWSGAGFSGSVTDRPGAPNGNYTIDYQNLSAGLSRPCNSGVQVDD